MSTQTDLETETWRFVNTINGTSRGGDISHQGIDPSTKKKLWDVPIATEDDLEDAVVAAQASFKTWSRTSWQSRQEILVRMSQVLADHRNEMSKILTMECGKPVSRITRIMI